MGEKETEREIPDIQAVEEFARAAGIEVDARQFIAVNQACGWMDGNGAPIRNWRTWLIGYAARNNKTQAPAEKKPNALNFHQRHYEEGDLDHLFVDLSKYDKPEQMEG